MIYNLRTEYDTGKSFYNKAKVEVRENKLILWSYTTEVAEIDTIKNEAVVFGTYSPTTLRHIKEFLKQNGFKAENLGQIMKDYYKNNK